MKAKDKTLIYPCVIPMSVKTKERIAAVADSIKGKEFFTDKIELAKKALSELESLPI